MSRSVACEVALSTVVSFISTGPYLILSIPSTLTGANANGGCGKMRWPTLRPVVRYVPSVAIIRYRAGDAGLSRDRSFGCRIPATTSAPSIAVAGSRGGQIVVVVPNCLADVSPKIPRLVTKRTKPT